MMWSTLKHKLAPVPGVRGKRSKTASLSLNLHLSENIQLPKSTGEQFHHHSHGRVFHITFSGSISILIPRLGLGYPSFGLVTYNAWNLLAPRRWPHSTSSLGPALSLWLEQRGTSACGKENGHWPNAFRDIWSGMGWGDKGKMKIFTIPSSL